MAHVSILVAFDHSYFLALIYLEHYTSRANQDFFSPHFFNPTFYARSSSLTNETGHSAEHTIWIFLLFQVCAAAPEFYSIFSKT